MGFLRRAAGSLSAWVEEGTGALTLLARGRQALLLKPVPRRLSWLYTMGSLAMFLFAVQFLTGFLLLAHYVPDARAAYRSVQEIQNHVPLGWLVRQMHSWGASLVVAALLLHMLKVLWYGGYKRPREFTWFLGVVLFLIALTFCFTGYLLPWNQLGRWATSVGTDAATKLPLLGRFLGELVRGGPEVSGQTLGRFFAMHVFVLPLALTLFLAAHLALIQRHGISPRARVDDEVALGNSGALDLSGGAEPFFPRQALRDLLVVNLGFTLLVGLATFCPWELGPPAAETTPEGIKPEWYFLPVYQFLKYFEDEVLKGIPVLNRVRGEVVGVGVINLLCVILLLLPVLDRGRERRIGKRPIFLSLLALSVVAVVGLGVLGHFSGRTVELLGATYRFSMKGYPTRVAAPAEPGPAPAPAPAPSAPPAAENEKTSPPAVLTEATQAASPVSGAAAGPPPAPSPAEAAAGQCGQCHRHQRQLEQWKLGVHARPPRPASACFNCHGGDPAAEDKDLAHKGVLTKESGRRGTVARKPEGPEVVELCGKCHGDVKAAFSGDHLSMEPARACYDCHSNHAIEPAGPATFEKGYKPDDPRGERFLAVKGAALSFEDGWKVEEKTIGRLAASLRAFEIPLSEFDEETAEAARLRREVRVVTHSLDADKVKKAGAAALAAAAEERKAMEARLEVLGRRKVLAAAVGTVSLAFALALAICLRRLKRREEGQPLGSAG